MKARIVIFHNTNQKKIVKEIRHQLPTSFAGVALDFPRPNLLE